MEAEPKLRTPVPQAVTPRSGLGKILLAEDNPDVRRVLATALDQHGYQVISARDGQEAAELYEANSAEIVAIVTDVVMPRMTGTDLARRIKMRDPDAKVLFLSGYNEDAPLDVPGTAYLQKPFPPRVLLAKLAELLDN